MTHKELASVLREAGWREERRPSGAHEFYREGSCARMIRMIASDPTHVLCVTRGEDGVVTTIGEAVAWAQASKPHGFRPAGYLYKVQEGRTRWYVQRTGGPIQPLRWDWIVASVGAIAAWLRTVGRGEGRE